MAEKLTMILIFQIMFEFILLIGFLVCLALLIRWISFVNTYLRQINRLKKKTFGSVATFLLSENTSLDFLHAAEFAERQKR